MRLIDADALLSKYVSNKYKDNILIARTDYAQGARDIIDDIIDAPTIEPEHNKGKWIPLKTRPMDEDERKEWSEKLGYKLEDYEAVIYLSLPDEGQEVLTCSRYGHIAMDKFENDPNYGCFFEENGDMDGIVAWMPLPKPWEGEECQLKDDTSHPFADDVLMGGD